jgi:hypothetical protein
MFINAHLPYIVLATGVLLTLVSFPVLRNHEIQSIRDHVARTLVTIGVGLVSVGVAFLTLSYSEQHVSDQEDLARKIFSQNFYKTALKYSFAAYEVRATRKYCGIDPIAADYDRLACRETADSAVRAANLVPSVDFVFNDAIRGSPNFASSKSLAGFLLDGELSIRVRLPAILATNIDAYINASRQPFTNRVRFLPLLEELQSIAEDMGSLYCLFSDKTSSRWSDFDSAVKQLDHDLEIVQSSIDRSQLIKKIVAGLSVPGTNLGCENVRHSIPTVLPGGGGGDGGAD